MCKTIEYALWRNVFVSFISFFLRTYNSFVLRAFSICCFKWSILQGMVINNITESYKKDNMQISKERQTSYFSLPTLKLILNDVKFHISIYPRKSGDKTFLLLSNTMRQFFLSFFPFISSIFKEPYDKLANLEIEVKSSGLLVNLRAMIVLPFSVLMWAFILTQKFI